MSAELYLELIDGLKSKKPKTLLALASSGSEEVCDRLRKKFKDAVFIDICDGPSAGDIAADLTTIEDGGLAIIKDIQFASFTGEDSILEVFETLFSNRELVLTLASGKKKSLELANFHIVCVCDGEIVLPEDLYRRFDETYKEDEHCQVSFDTDEETESDSSDEHLDSEATEEKKVGASHDGGVSIRRFYGNMDWFDVAEQPASFSDVPVEFEAAYKLWKLDRVKNEAAIIALLSPFVRGVFVIYALDKWEMLFEGSEDDYEGMEIQASKVNVVGIDFKTQPFPKCRVEAWFDVPVKDDFDEIDLDEWQEEEGVSLSDVIAFRWDVPKNDSTEDLDFSCGDNLGVEVVFQGAVVTEDTDEDSEPGVEEDTDEVETASLEGLTIFSAKPKFAAVWAFYPNAELKAQYPDAENDDVSMDLQEEEMLAVKPISTVKKGGDLIIELAEGRLQLVEFKQAWQEGIVPDDAIVWDIERIVEAWSSD